MASTPPFFWRRKRLSPWLNSYDPHFEGTSEVTVPSRMASADSDHQPPKVISYHTLKLTWSADIGYRLSTGYIFLATSQQSPHIRSCYWQNGKLKFFEKLGQIQTKSTPRGSIISQENIEKKRRPDLSWPNSPPLSTILTLQSWFHLRMLRWKNKVRRVGPAASLAHDTEKLVVFTCCKTVG